MDNDNSNGGEKVALIITVIIIAFAVLYLLYVVFMSNKSITNNIMDTTNDIKNGIENTTEDMKDGIEDTTDNIRNGIENTTENVKDKTEEMKNNIKNDINNEAAKAPVETEISAFTTSIYDKDEGRIYNISLATQKLNDTIVKQGEEFSFINTVGTMGESEGYKKTLGFDSEGRKIQIAGGGLCQLSSTLYNAVLNAQMEVTERHAHSRRVYYVPKDKDATVCYPSLDFKFINNTNEDIKIKVASDGDNVTVKLYKIM